jgi:hypothetical protein
MNDKIDTACARSKNCENCGSVFRKKPNHTLARWQAKRFCSFACSVAGRGERVPLEIRFASKVDKDGPAPEHRPDLGQCHLWTGARSRTGYGHINVDGKIELAHRVAWLLGKGEWPDPCALHKCDNGHIGCVRLEHLFEGTQADNVADRDAKQRGDWSRPATGEKNGLSKLTEVQVVEIREALKRRVPGNDLAHRYDVAKATISRIKTGKNWRQAR